MLASLGNYFKCTYSDGNPRIHYKKTMELVWINCKLYYCSQNELIAWIFTEMCCIYYAVLGHNSYIELLSEAMHGISLWFYIIAKMLLKECKKEFVKCNTIVHPLLNVYCFVAIYHLYIHCNANINCNGVDALNWIETVSENLELFPNNRSGIETNRYTDRNISADILI